MTIKPAAIEGCFLITPQKFEDDRGYFFESFNKKEFEAQTQQDITFVQDNVSKSTYGVLRGLHYQTGVYAQAKLVSVSEGRVLDIAVDIRPNSPSYGKHLSVELSAENNQQLFIPRGFAHGFVVLSEVAVFRYKCDNYYSKAHENGLYFNQLNIDWKLPMSDIIVNHRDRNYPLLKEV